MSDRVLVGIASIPQRASSLHRVVASLAPQVDRIEVSLNGYKDVPRFFSRFPNVHGTVRDQAGGDAEKFAAVDDWDGYVATCDDDVLYPPDYIKTLIAGIERHGRNTAVSFHGGSTLGWTHRSCAASVKRIRCLDTLEQDDTDVNVVGTGTLGFHSGHVPVWRDAFRHPNMADVQMAVHGRTLGIPFTCLAHKKRWLRDICPLRGPRIYEANRDNDGTFQDTRVNRYDELNRVDWHAPAPDKPTVHVAVATCSRPDKLLELLGDLERESGWCDLTVHVYEDPTDATYTDARAFCMARGWPWTRFPERLGKREHWQLVNRELQDARNSRAGWFLFLPDDVRLVRHAIPRAITIWDRLEDAATLTLWRLQAFEGSPSWTGKRPVQREYATETFHVDGLYLCRRETLETLGFHLPDVGANRNAELSSGVGAWMSKQLHAQRNRMYRVDGSLALANDDGVSVMNPEDRVRFPAVAL